MRALSELIDDRLRGVPEYRAGKVAAGPRPGENYGKLSSNEPPLGIGTGVRRALREAVDTLSLYPLEHELTAELAASLGLPADHLVLTNGSDELCSLIALLLLGPGRTAVVADPGYAIDVKASVISGAQLRRVPLLPDGHHDVRRMAAAAQDADVVWFPNPHNPTGTALPARDVQWLLEQVPPGCVVVLDEAYRAFAAPDRTPDAAALLAAHENLIIQRTFSKDRALAGLRLGYGIARPFVAQALTRLRPPFSVNAMAVAAGCASLREDEPWRVVSAGHVVAQRQRFEDWLAGQGIHFLPSQANFVLVRIPHAAVAGRLAAAGISVRPGEDLGMPGWVRITVGWAPVMARLRCALAPWAAGDRSGAAG